jgi:hypothetical protein
MIHNIAFKANRNGIQKQKQDLINKSNKKENKRCIPHEYKVGDQILLETPGILRKLSTPCTGAYTITQYTRMEQSKFKRELYPRE